MTTTRTADPMIDSTADPLYFVVVCETARTRRYFAGSATGYRAAVTDDLTRAWRFETEGEAALVRDMGRQQHSGSWKIVRIMPARKPTITDDEIAARVAARRAARKADR